MKDCNHNRKFKYKSYFFFLDILDLNIYFIFSLKEKKCKYDKNLSKGKTKIYFEPIGLDLGFEK